MNSVAEKAVEKSPSHTFAPFLVPGNILERHRVAGGLGDPENIVSLERLSALHRINTLAGLRSAAHGWLGACFSAMELMTVIYHRFIPEPTLPIAERNSLILSKGHAAMAQYAILAGLGAFPLELLLSYQAIDGLPAHSDGAVPGIDTDSGSLGQGLSKGIGLALANRAAGRYNRVFVILGDGELQEGQVFEALLTLSHQKLRSCIPIIDRNFLQSDSPTAQIKDAEDWATVLRGVGFLPFSIDGHDVPAILAALRGKNEGPRPLAIIAQTRKGFGTSKTTMAPDTPRRQGIWHGRIPDDKEYLEMLTELVGRVADPDLETAFKSFECGCQAVSAKAVSVQNSNLEPVQSTGEGFGEALVELAEKFPLFHVLDADLEKSCRLTHFAETFPARFHEIGISEQDMTSIGAGLALGGRIAVVNTYASFFKRCLDQVSATSAEKLPVIFAGHYAGLDYFTDGKSHQSIQDVGLMRAIGGIDIMEPLTPEEACQMLVFLFDKMSVEIRSGKPSRPAYMRLHRSAVHGLPGLPHSFACGKPYVFPGTEPNPLATIFAAGPQFLDMALQVQGALAGEGLPVEVVGLSSYEMDSGNLASIVASARVPVALESHLIVGGLADLIAPACRIPPIRIGAVHVTGSTRHFQEMLSAHGLEFGAVAGIVRNAIREAVEVSTK